MGRKESHRQSRNLSHTPFLDKTHITIIHSKQSLSTSSGSRVHGPRGVTQLCKLSAWLGKLGSFATCIANKCDSSVCLDPCKDITIPVTIDHTQPLRLFATDQILDRVTVLSSWCCGRACSLLLIPKCALDAFLQETSNSKPTPITMHFSTSIHSSTSVTNKVVHHHYEKKTRPRNWDAVANS